MDRLTDEVSQESSWPMRFAEYMLVKERKTSGIVRLQGAEVMKVQEFKYLGPTL